MKQNRISFSILVVIVAALIATPNYSVAQNSVEGTLTVNDETTELKYAYADEYDGDITVFVADAEIPREAIPDATFDLGANGAFKGLVFSVSSESLELQSGGWYELVNAVHFHPVLNEQGDIGEPTLSAKRADDEMLIGTIATGGPKDLYGNQLAYEIAFSVSLKKVPLEVTVTGANDDASKAFEGWLRSLFAGDIEAMKPYLSAEVVEMLATADEAEVAESLEFQQMMMPTNIQIVGSDVTGDQAILNVKGQRAMETSKGTVTMMKEDGMWKIGEQSWEAGDTE